MSDARLRIVTPNRHLADLRRQHARLRVRYWLTVTLACASSGAIVLMIVFDTRLAPPLAPLLAISAFAHGISVASISSAERDVGWLLDTLTEIDALQDDAEWRLLRAFKDGRWNSTEGGQDG